MDRTMKIFFFFCFAVFFFSGCGKTNRNEKINGRNSRESEKATDQQKMEIQNKELIEIQKLLATSDRLFTQSWQIITKNKDQNPSNVFRVVNALLQEHQKMEKEKENSKEKNVKNPKPAEASVERMITPVLKVEQTEMTAKPEKVSRIYTIGYRTKEMQVTDEPLQIATFKKSQNNSWKIEFTAKNLGDEFNGLGRMSLQLSDVRCETLHPKDGVLWIMDCYNLAQDIDENKVLVLTRMTLDRRKRIDKCEAAFQLRGMIIDESRVGSDKENVITMKDFCENGVPKINLSPTEFPAEVEVEAEAEPEVSPNEPATPAPTPAPAPSPATPERAAPNEHNSSPGSDSTGEPGTDQNREREDYQQSSDQEELSTDENRSSENAEEKSSEQNSESADAVLPPEAVT